MSIIKQFENDLRLILLMTGLAVFGAACSNAPVSSVPDKSSNQEMAALLDSLRQATNPMDNYSLNSRRAEILAAKVANAKDVNARIETRFQMAAEYLRAGQTDRAITELSGLIQTLEGYGLGLDDQTKIMYSMQALAYLRMGEQENCLGQPNPAACILPLSPEGVHQFKRGSETAIQLYEKILESFPDDRQLQWLLNLAYMTIGEYPQGVPKKWLIDPKSFESEESGFSNWKDEANKLGVDIKGLSGSVCMEDFNNDGLLDLFVSSYGLNDPCKFLINTGSGFRDASAAAGLEGISGGLNVTHADYNNDGFMDVLVLRGAWFNKGGAIPNSLLRNNGDETFTDVTKEAGLLSFHPTQTATWADFNNDGHLDLYIGNETTNSNGTRLIHPCEFYLNNGNGTFSEMAASLGIAEEAWVKAVVSGDYNGDGLMDIYVSVLGGINKLYRNAGSQGGLPQKFEEVAAAAGIQNPVMSFPAWFWDYDQDGLEDLFVISYDFRELGEIGAFQKLDYEDKLAGQIEYPALYHNTGDGTFTNATGSANLSHAIFGMGSNYGDLNSDGYPDFYIGTGSPDFGSVVPNRMFLNKGGTAFTEVTMNGFAHIQKGHGIAFGDIDNDGDQDVYAVMGGAYEGDVSRNVLFENPGTGSNWINIQLEGTSANRCAIGARIKLDILEADGTSHSLYRTVRTGGSFGSSPLRQFFGMGQAQAIQAISIYWPGKKEPQVHSGEIKLNLFIRIKEGRKEIEYLSNPKVQ